MDTITKPLAIIGTGPAGYTASIYASRYKVDNVVIGTLLGGQAAESHKICNYPSHPDIPGSELMMKFQKHSKDLGAEEIFDTVTEISGEFGNFTLKTAGGKEVHAQTVLLAIGTKHRMLGLPNEDKFLGKGVTYCATCDGMLYRDKIVAVIGGADGANTASIYLSEIASKVYQIYRRDKLRGEPAWAEQVINNPKIEVIYNTNLTALNGTERLESITLDKPYNSESEIKIDGLFVEIGSHPDPTLPKQLGVETDEDGYIKVAGNQSTNVKGVLAAGDVTTASNGFRQIVTACGEGAVAARTAFEILQENK